MDEPNFQGEIRHIDDEDFFNEAKKQSNVPYEKDQTTSVNGVVWFLLRVVR